jgi:AraC-like DNA-binding protein
MATFASRVRRLRLSNIEQVTHEHQGQEWVPHWHEEWSFGAIVQGQCRCSIGGKLVIARSGDLLAIPPKVVHTGALLLDGRDDDVSVVMLYVPERWMQQAGLNAPAHSLIMPAASLAREAAYLESTEQIEGWLHRAVSEITRTASNPSPAASEPLPSASVRALLSRVHEAVLSGEQSVGGIAQRCGVSRERIHRVLKHWLGMSTAQYLRAVRILRARQLLLEGWPISLTAAECGFSDQAHFTRWFKRTFGYTPARLVLPLPKD